MKKQIDIPAVDPLNEMHTMQEWSSILDQYPRNLINNAPWATFNYTPLVSFSMAYSKDAILIKYHVQEEHVRATAVHPNDLVHKDSCVEFFISFNDGKSYYNLEFNCIGTCYGGFGYAGMERSSLPAELIKEIGYHAELQQSASDKELIEWSLTLKIPISVFINDPIHSLGGLHANANFYKCGDDSCQPPITCRGTGSYQELPIFIYRSILGNWHLSNDINYLERDHILKFYLENTSMLP